MIKAAEVWKDIIGFKGYYQVSNRGNVRSLTRMINHKNGKRRIYKGAVMSPFKGEYLQINLCKYAKYTEFKIHALVCSAFIGKRPNGQNVNHKDGKKYNNNLYNLEYTTPKQNMVHAVRIGLMPIGSKSYLSKLKEKDIPEIRELLKSGLSHEKIGLMFGVGKNTIGGISRNRTWRHV